MKGLALSYTLLTGASLVASQTTVWEDFTATVSAMTLTKPIVASTSSVTAGSAGTTTTSSSVNYPSISPSFIYQNSSSASTSIASTSIAAALVPTSDISITSNPDDNLYSDTTTSTIISASPADLLDSSPSSTESSSQTTLVSATATAILNEHNRLRALHVDTQPLVWSDDLSAWAYDYASSLTGTDYDPCSGNLIHSTTRGNQGENIAFATYSSSTALVDLWYNEIEYYDYNNVTGIYHDGQEVGHFTQLVWNSSTAVGCAAIECPANNGLYLLCEYTPAGNVYDVSAGADLYEEFATNVLPLK